MDNSFAITFDFPFEGTSKVIPVKAIVDCLSPKGVYLVDAFELLSNGGKTKRKSFLCRQEIKRLDQDNVLVWVHQDSEKPTSLAAAIGRAIDALETP